MAAAKRPSSRPQGPAPTPPGSTPGRHPRGEQDDPTTPPPVPDATVAGTDAPERPLRGGRLRFPFAFSFPLAPVAAVFGVVPPTAHVDVDDRDLSVRFGLWSLRTPLANVRSLSIAGPYSWWKVGGPARVSLADQGVTFATTTARGVCISFHHPVPAALPRHLVAHPGVTVTVADPEGLVAAVAARTDIDA
jgi:hypothetical protein